MTVLLALSTADRLGALALLAMAVGLALLADASRRRTPPPRPTRTASIEITPRFLPPSTWADLRRPRIDSVAATAVAYAQTSRPRSHLRTLGPRPFDWSIDDPDLAVTPWLTPADVARLFDLEPEDLGLPLGHPPVRLVVDETPLLDRR